MVIVIPDSQSCPIVFSYIVSMVGNATRGNNQVANSYPSPDAHKDITREEQLQSLRTLRFILLIADRFSMRHLLYFPLLRSGLRLVLQGSRLSQWMPRMPDITCHYAHCYGGIHSDYACWMLLVRECSSTSEARSMGRKARVRLNHYVWQYRSAHVHSAYSFST